MNQPSTFALVPFEGETLEANRDAGTVWVSVRRACESLGIDFSTQLAKLKEKSWAVMGQRPTTGPDGKTYEATCLDLESFPMWLATIDSARVSDEARPKLDRYQRLAAAVLRRHFFGEASATEHASARALVRATFPHIAQRALNEGDVELAHHLTGFILRRTGKTGKKGQLGLFDHDPPARPEPEAPDAFDNFLTAFSTGAHAGTLIEETHYTMVDGKLHLHLRSSLLALKLADAGERVLMRLAALKPYVVATTHRSHFGKARPRCIVIDCEKVPEHLDFERPPITKEKGWGGVRGTGWGSPTRGEA